MTLTKQEIQELIDRSSDDDINTIRKNAEKVISDATGLFSYNKKFVKKYFYETWVRVIKGADVSWSTESSTLDFIINTLDFNESDWDELGEFIIKFHKSDIDSYGEISKIMGYSNKNVAFSRYMIKNHDIVRSTFSDLSHTIYSYNNRIESKNIDGLSSDELDKLGDALDIFPNGISMGVIFPDKDIIKRILKTPAKIIDYGLKSMHDIGKIYNSAPLEEVIDAIEYMLTIEFKRQHLAILNWFKGKKIILDDDDLLDRIVTKWNKPIQLLPALSKEKTIEYYGNLGESIIIKNTNLSIDEVVEIANSPNGKESLFGSRFFTDEEIAKYPHLFDPRNLKYGPSAYVSKETFKLLNKSAGTRQRYNTEYSDFKVIYRRHVNERYHLSDEEVMYLKEKTNCSNKEFIKSIDNVYTNREVLQADSKILLLGKFCANSQ